jgi:endonuclease YncB( thermonuclease family)
LVLLRKDDPMRKYPPNSFIIMTLHALLCLMLAADVAFAQKLAPIRTVVGAVADVWSGEAVQVVTPDKARLAVRLYGVDAPETPEIDRRTGRVVKVGEPFGAEAWGALRMKIIGKTARIDVVESDRHKCVSGIVWVDGRNINLEIVREGFVRLRFDGLREPYRTPFINAQGEAQAAKRGIWFLPRLHEGPTERHR